MTGSGGACRLGILLSGRGSNFRAIHQAIQEERLQAEIAVVFSNHAEAAGLSYAREQGLPAAHLDKAGFENRQAYDAALTRLLQEHRVDWIILAGYDRILGAPLLNAYAGRILNIHPSLLPAYGGKNMVGLKVHAAVLAGGETESGCTVHGVTETVDGGPILGQSRVPVLPGDTPETLAERVLAAEHRLYPEVIQRIIQQPSSSGEETHVSIQS